jgi:hypothetical protein
VAHLDEEEAPLVKAEAVEVGAVEEANPSIPINMWSYLQLLTFA